MADSDLEAENKRLKQLIKNKLNDQREPMNRRLSDLTEKVLACVLKSRKRPLRS